MRVSQERREREKERTTYHATHHPAVVWLDGAAVSVVGAITTLLCGKRGVVSVNVPQQCQYEPECPREPQEVERQALAVFVVPETTTSLNVCTHDALDGVGPVVRAGLQHPKYGDHVFLRRRQEGAKTVVDAGQLLASGHEGQQRNISYFTTTTAAAATAAAAAAAAGSARTAAGLHRQLNLGPRTGKGSKERDPEVSRSAV